MITLTPNYIIRNNYNLPILFNVVETDQDVNMPGKSTGYLNRDGFDSSFHFVIETNKQASEVTVLNLNNKGLVPVSFSPNSAFSLRFDKDIITLQPPLLVKNLTEVPIAIFDFQDNLITNLQPNKDSEEFLGPPDFFNEGKISLSIQLEGYEKSPVFDTTTGNKEIYLKSLTSDLSIPIALLVYLKLQESFT